MPGSMPRVSSQRNGGTTTGMVAQVGEYVLLMNLPPPASPTVQKSPKSSTKTLPAGGAVVTTVVKSIGVAVRTGPTAFVRRRAAFALGLVTAPVSTTAVVSVAVLDNPARTGWPWSAAAGVAAT